MAKAEAGVQGRIEADSTGGELRIRISNAKRFNAMTLAMWEDLARVVKAVDDDQGIRVVVLSGDGNKAFASGADISEFATHRDDPEQSARFSAAVHAAQEALSNCRHPTVAIIRGVCMGGGMTLAMACDLRYCTNGARFRMPAGRVGLGYDSDGIKRFVNTLGASRTADLFFTARTFDGHEASRIGLVHESFDSDVFETITRKRIDAITSLAPLTLRAVKLALRHVMNESGAPDKRFVDEAIQACFRSQDYTEGQQAFLEKREPKFTGR